MTRAPLIYLDGCTTCAIFSANGDIEHHIHPDDEGDDADDEITMMHVLGAKTEHELAQYIVEAVSVSAVTIRNAMTMINGMEDKVLARQTISLVSAALKEAEVGTVTITEHDIPPPGRTKH